MENEFKPRPKPFFDVKIGDENRYTVNREYEQDALRQLRDSVGKFAHLKSEENEYFYIDPWTGDDHVQREIEVFGNIVDVDAFGVTIDVQSGRVHYQSGYEGKAEEGQVKYPFYYSEFNLRQYAKDVQVSSIIVDGEDLMSKTDVSFGAEQTA